MAVMELWRRRDLEGAVKTEYIDGNFFTQDSAGNMVGVKCYKDGAEVTLTGSVTGYCVLPSGETVSVAGTRSGNQASILVPQSALAYSGPLGIVLKLIDGNTITTLMSIIVVVYRSKTDTVITPSSQIITDWANQISAAMQAVADASAAQDAKIADLKSEITGIQDIVYTQAELKFASGNITPTGVAGSNNKYIRSSLPMAQIETGDIVIVDAPYKIFNCISFNDNKITAGTFNEAITVDNVNLLFVPESYVGKYLGLTINKVGHISEDISADVATIGDYVHYLKRIDLSEIPTRPNAIMGPYLRTPKISKSGSTYTVAIRGYSRAAWDRGSKIGTVYKNEEHEVANGYTLVYDPANDAYSVIGISHLGTDSRNYIPLLLNAAGALYGQWSQFYYDSLTVASDDNLPQYYTDGNYIQDKVSAVLTQGLSIGKQGGRFAFITDYHRQQNTKNSGALLKYITANTGIRRVVFGGDSEQSEATQLEGYSEIVGMTGDFAEAEALAEFYYITGNHEFNDPNVSTPARRLNVETIYQLFNVGRKGIVQIDDGGNDYYLDDDDCKIRYYFIGCNMSAAISVIQRRAIGDSLLTVPEGYAVFVISHVGLKWDTDNSVVAMNTQFEHILQCCKAMNDGVSVTVEYAAGSTRTFDYTGKARTFIGAICGHCHFDECIIYDGRFPVISTTCDAYAATPSHHSPDRTAGTVNEQAFDVVQFDVASKRIYLTRIGQGNDRAYSFGSGAQAIV